MERLPYLYLPALEKFFETEVKVGDIYIMPPTFEKFLATVAYQRLAKYPVILKRKQLEIELNAILVKLYQQESSCTQLKSRVTQGIATKDEIDTLRHLETLEAAIKRIDYIAEEVLVDLVPLPKCFLDLRGVMNGGMGGMDGMGGIVPPVCYFTNKSFITAFILDHEQQNSAKTVDSVTALDPTSS